MRLRDRLAGDLLLPVLLYNTEEVVKLDRAQRGSPPRSAAVRGYVFCLNESIETVTWTSFNN